MNEELVLTVCHPRKVHEKFDASFWFTVKKRKIQKRLSILALEL